MMKPVLLLGALSGGFAVAMGAFAAHGLRDLLGTQALAWVETGVRYQAWHSLALVAVAILASRRPNRILALSAAAFFGGILLFSGSLYAMALSGARWLGVVTPVGGVFLLLGWALLAIYAWRYRSN